MKKKLKIAMFFSSNAQQAGGDKEHLLNLSSSLSARGHHIDIYGPKINIYPFKNYHSITDTIFLPLPGWNNVSVNVPIKDGKLIVKEINSKSYDLIHIHDPHTPFFTYQLMKELKAIKVATFHNAWDNNSVFNMFYPIMSLFEETFYKHYRGAIFVSKITKKRWLYLCKNRPYKTIYSGVSKNFKPAKKIKKCKKINLLFLARLVARKNPLFLLRAFKGAVKINPNLFLTFIGKGEMEKELLNYIKHNNLSKNVIMKGEIIGDKRIIEYQKSDIFCAPYINEAFGLTIIEAMACGIPIVGFKNESLKEILKKYPNLNYLVEPKNLNKYIEAIINLSKNSSERSLLSKWLIEESKKYNWEKVAYETEEFYYKVLNK